MVRGFVFGRFSAHLDSREQWEDRVRAELGVRAFDILTSLIEALGELVSKDEGCKRQSRATPGDVNSC
jgi:hypothetical protein